MGSIFFLKLRPSLPHPSRMYRGDERVRENAPSVFVQYSLLSRPYSILQKRLTPSKLLAMYPRGYTGVLQRGLKVLALAQP